jgi:hypothetical protein
VNNDLIDVVSGAATVALIVTATRWLAKAKGAQNPTSRNGTNVYGIKWQIRAVSYIAAVLLLFVSIEGLRHDPHSAQWTLDLLFIGLALASLWFGSGVVVTDQFGITKKSLWKSQILGWDDISQIQLHKKDAGAIELRAGSRKLIVDSRFVAAAFLLKEIEDRTNVPVTRD